MPEYTYSQIGQTEAGDMPTHAKFCAIDDGVLTVNGSDQWQCDQTPQHQYIVLDRSPDDARVFIGVDDGIVKFHDADVIEVERLNEVIVVSRGIKRPFLEIVQLNEVIVTKLN